MGYTTTQKKLPTTLLLATLILSPLSTPSSLSGQESRKEESEGDPGHNLSSEEPRPLSIPVPRSAQLGRWLSQLTERYPENTRNTLERSGRYASFIRSELEKRGMPPELLYLAMIESGYSPNAISSARATGLWQFMAGTARLEGLEVSYYVDERRDPVRSTEAALTHLEKMYKYFGSWSLAAAAYNAGPANVERAMRRTLGRVRRTTDEGVFWRISWALPRETRLYLPRWLAAYRVGMAPEQHGLEGITYEAPLVFETIEVPGGTKLSTLARMLGVEPEVLYDLNPHLIRRQTPPRRKWEVRIPPQPRPSLELATVRTDLSVGNIRSQISATGAVEASSALSSF